MSSLQIDVFSVETIETTFRPPGLEPAALAIRACYRVNGEVIIVERHCFAVTTLPCQPSAERVRRALAFLPAQRTEIQLLPALVLDVLALSLELLDGRFRRVRSEGFSLWSRCGLTSAPVPFISVHSSGEEHVVLGCVGCLFDVRFGDCHAVGSRHYL